MSLPPNARVRVYAPTKSAKRENTPSKISKTCRKFALSLLFCPMPDRSVLQPFELPFLIPVYSILVTRSPQAVWSLPQYKMPHSHKSLSPLLEGLGQSITLPFLVATIRWCCFVTTCRFSWRFIASLSIISHSSTSLQVRSCSPCSLPVPNLWLASRLSFM